MMRYAPTRYDPAGGKVIESLPNGCQDGIVGEDLRGLFQRLVLADGNKHRSRTAVACDRDVLTPIGHLVEQLGKVRAELADRHGLGHGESAPHRVHKAGRCQRADFERLLRDSRPPMATAVMGPHSQIGELVCDLHSGPTSASPGLRTVTRSPDGVAGKPKMVGHRPAPRMPSRTVPVSGA